MFANNHYQLQLHHQNELEASARNGRIISIISRETFMVSKESREPLRKRIGTMLISFGQKLAQEPKKKANLAFSAHQ